jgi:hypothetical protein
MPNKARLKRAAEKLADEKRRVKVSDSTLQAASPHASEIGDKRKVNQLAVLVTPLQKQQKYDFRYFSIQHQADAASTISLGRH